MLDHLCEECSEHFEDTKRFLSAAGFEYEIDPMIVRGWIIIPKPYLKLYPIPSAPRVRCGGGRYDGLVEECGGPGVPGVGFGLGLERLLLVLESQNIEMPERVVCDVYFATIGEKPGLRPLSWSNCCGKKGFLLIWIMWAKP